MCLVVVLACMEAVNGGLWSWNLSNTSVCQYGKGIRHSDWQLAAHRLLIKQQLMQIEEEVSLYLRFLSVLNNCVCACACLVVCPWLRLLVSY